MSNTIQPGAVTRPNVRGDSPQKSADASADNGSPVAAQGGDSVQLTASARAIDQASRATDVSGSVDTGHVERVRQALASGSYQVDATRIADKLLKMEHQIGGKG